MPNKANAWKALRQSKVRATRNARTRNAILYLRRQLTHATTSNDAPAAATAYRALQKTLDRAVQKGVMKLNTVARLKSRAVAKLPK